MKPPQTFDLHDHDDVMRLGAAIGTEVARELAGAVRFIKPEARPVFFCALLGAIGGVMAAAMDEDAACDTLEILKGVVRKAVAQARAQESAVKH